MEAPRRECHEKAMLAPLSAMLATARWQSLGIPMCQSNGIAMAAPPRRALAAAALCQFLLPWQSHGSSIAPMAAS